MTPNKAFQPTVLALRARPAAERRALGGLLKSRAAEVSEVERMQTQEFGCDICWPADAGAAWGARGGLTRLEELIDESHFSVAILICPRCGQRHVSIFTEMIDWEDGNDPQYWTLMPITEVEAEGLIRQGASLNEVSLDALGRGRRALRRDHPKAGPPRVFWGSGVLVGPHD